MDRNSIIVSEFTWYKLGKAVMNIPVVGVLQDLIDHIHIIPEDKFDEVISMLKQGEIRDDQLITEYYNN